MARSDLVIKLAQASLEDDKQLIRRTIEAIIAEERARQHHIYAQKLSDALQLGRWTQRNQYEKKTNSLEIRQSSISDAEELLMEIKPRKPLSELILDTNLLDVCEELVEEHMRADLLRSHSIEPRNRILLVGPPGNGKTSLAEAIAFSLGIPFYIIKYEAVIGSYLGETASRLKQVFDFVKTRPCVVFFDEFDAIGKERGDIHETGEIKRVVSSLLLQIDSLPSYNVVVAATNHPELIDRAAWRRFQIKMELNPPSEKQIQVCIKKFETDIGEKIEHSHTDLSNGLYGLSYSAIENFFLDIKRKIILSHGRADVKKIISKQIAHLKPKSETKEEVIGHGNTTPTRPKSTNKKATTERQSEIF